jgi:quercetin dioxygenase-like cupin family protein
MSQERQSAVFHPLGDVRSQITTLTRDYPPACVVALHFHDRDQLVYASRGVMTVSTSEGAWVVPTRTGRFGSLRPFRTALRCQAQ